MNNVKDLIDESVKVLEDLHSETLDDDHNGRLATCKERIIELRLLHHFFTCGKLANKQAMQPCNDEEYLAGVLDFAQELSRYSIIKASEVFNY